MTEALIVERHGDAMELTLNRPERRNALTRDLIEATADALRHASAQDTVRAIILTGAPPAFCAGLDLHEVLETRADHDVDTQPLLRLIETVEGLTKPVIAAVNGAATAGGATLAGVCDLVICGASAQFAFPGIRYGLAAPIVVPFLLRLASSPRAAQLLLTGEPIDATTAVAWGLATEVVPDAELRQRCRAVAETIAARPIDAIASMKSLLRIFRHAADGRATERRHLCERMPLPALAREAIQSRLESDTLERTQPA